MTHRTAKIAQAIFDRVATHLFTQGRQASVDKVIFGQLTEHCVYRTPDGLRCAVGVLIEDDEYDPEMEGVCAPDLAFRFPGLEWMQSFGCLLDDLQTVHDGDENWASTKVMRAELAHVAKKHDLDPTILRSLSFSDR